MTRILALETATQEASVAAWDGRLVVERRRRVTTHSEMLLPLLDEVLTAAGWTRASIDAVACGAGPGSFTGLRIGCATAKGLCFALARPIVMVSSLAALAARGEGRVLATLDAYKQEVYAGLYGVDGVLLEGDERVGPPDEIAAWAASVRPDRVLGDGAKKYPQLRVARFDESDDGAAHAAEVARLAASRLANHGPDDLATASPRYIRPSEAEMMKAKLKNPV